MRHDAGEHADGTYQLCGHVHPCIRLSGKAKQSLRLPCFYFTQHLGLLPAFGGFTGMHAIKPVSGDVVVGIAEGDLVRIQ